MCLDITSIPSTRPPGSHTPATFPLKFPQSVSLSLSSHLELKCLGVSESRHDHGCTPAIVRHVGYDQTLRGVKALVQGICSG